MSAALRIERLGVSAGRRPIIEDLTLPPIRAGEVTALVGPNGSGKSTVIRAIAQVTGSKGTLAFGDNDLRTLAPQQRAALIGYMPQALPQAVELTTIESVLVALRFDAGTGSAEKRAVAVLERLGIARLALARLDAMSGGERQMVSLAQAIVREPKLLLLDEPTSALDLARQIEVMRLLRRLAAAGCAILVVIHDLALAARTADRICMLANGRLHAHGKPEDVLTSRNLAEVYGIAASVERLRDHLVILPDPEGLPGTGQNDRWTTK